MSVTYLISESNRIFCHAIINEFNLAGQDAQTTSTQIADSLVNIAKNMSTDFGTGVESITKGIQLIGTVASQVGKLTSTETEAMLGAIIEKTRLSGETVATGLVI